MAGPDRVRVAGAANRIEVLLFDLGGVLVDFVGVEALHTLTDERHELEEIRRRWSDSPALAKLEVGECSAPEFAREFTTEWGLSVDPAHFFATFVAWSQEPYALDLASLTAAQVSVLARPEVRRNLATFRRGDLAVPLDFTPNLRGVMRVFAKHVLGRRIALGPAGTDVSGNSMYFAFFARSK